MMKAINKPSVTVIHLRNGDSALYLGDNQLVAVEADDRHGVSGIDTAQLGHAIADAFGALYSEHIMDVPTDPEWNWNDVLELLPAEQEPDNGQAGNCADMKEAIQNGLEAFWARIAKAYPAATSGDLPPEAEIMLEEAMTTAVEQWVHYNVPDSAIFEIKKGDPFKSIRTGQVVQVEEVQGQQVAFYAYGGGFRRLSSVADFRKAFKPFDIDGSAFLPALFVVADAPYAVPGFHKPHDRWNGWACPYFTKQSADFLATKIDGMVYDEASDAYVISGPDYDEPETFGSVDIEVDGTVVKTYPIGAGSWVWVAFATAADLPEGTVPNIEV